MDNSKDSLWPVFIVLGMIPGLVIWLLLVRLGLAGEYAGIIAGFGAATVFNYFRCKISKVRIAIGCFIILVMIFITNHLAYAMDIFFTFSGQWYGEAGGNISFGECIVKTWKLMVALNVEGLRKFYFEAMISGVLCTLIMWLGIMIFKYSTIEEEENGR